MKCTSWTLQHCVGNRVGIRSVYIDPWTAARIKNLRKCADTCSAVNASRGEPLNAYIAG
jgi:hypothetical protein